MILLFVLPAMPQSGTGAVSGSVTDQSGSFVPGATATLTNTATQVTLKTTTNDVGFYMFPGITPGSYSLSVEAPGMEKFEGTLTVQVQQRAVVDVTLRVGQIAATVTVRDVTPLTTLDNATLGHVLERERIEQLPINGRNIGTLLQTVPGMEGNRAYAQKTGTQDMLLDGAAIGDRLWGYTSQRRPPGLDTVQEFKVETNNSSAKMTRPVTVIVATKGGTNDLHGAAFETARNNAIGVARSRTDTWTKAPKLIRNEFGASAGGPVWLPGIYNGKNRTFWFFSYEAYRLAAESRWNGTVPTQAMRNGDFRGLTDSRGNLYKLYDPWTTNTTTWERQPFAYGGQLNVIDPARMSPLAKQLFAITPLPTHPDVNPLLDSNWWGKAPNTSRQYTITTRVDHRFTDNDRFFMRYTKGDEYTFSQDWNLPMLDMVAGSVRRIAPNQNAALSYVRTFSATFFNELLLSAAKDKRYKGTGEPGVKYADRLGLPNPLGAPGWPGIYDTGLDDYYFETDNTQDSPFTYFILDDNMTKIKGRHELQFGFHWRGDRLNILPDQQQPQGNHSFNSLATSLYDPTTARTAPSPTPFTGQNMGNMYLGVMTYSNQFVRGYWYSRGREYAAYFQDNYKVTPRLTLNLGLRYEFFPAYKEKNNFVIGFDFDKRAIVLGDTVENFYKTGATTPVIVQRFESLGAKFISYRDAGLPHNLVHNDYNDFGPRLGVAYRVGGGLRPLVVRGGYRLSYFPLPVRSWGVTMRSNTPSTARFYNNPNAAERSPDGIRNYLMRSVPTIVAGKNSSDAVSLNDPKSVLSLSRGSASVFSFDPNQPTSLAHDWNVTFEKEVMQNTVVRAGYVGNAGRNLDQNRAINNAMPDYIWYATTGLQLPTGEYSAVARRDWDQTVYGNLNRYQKTGYSNYHGVQLEAERRFNRGYGFQVFYNFGNAYTVTAMSEQAGGIAAVNQFLPGAVPQDTDQRNRFLNYGRDSSIPQHRVRWNWIAELPFGKGKLLGRNAGGFLDRLIGGWQIAGMGNWSTRWITLPTNVFPNLGSGKIEIYQKKYPIQDCTSGTCYPAYLYWNGYLPADKINSYNASTGKPNGYMGVPDTYKPAAQPLLPWPAKPSTSDPLYPYYGSNTVWLTLKNGTVQRITYNDNLPAWRNQYIHGPGSWGLDASLFKQVAITERVHIRINADFFNVLNRPGTPNAGGNGVLSMRSSALSPREVQLTGRVIW
ncbi:MAG: carboxypeptidase regulatory-like domain-containing protein [Bryobacteraceae bacterium]